MLSPVVLAMRPQRAAMVTTRAFLIDFSVPWLEAETKRHSPQNDMNCGWGTMGVSKQLAEAQPLLAMPLRLIGNVDKFGFRRPKKKRPQSGGN